MRVGINESKEKISNITKALHRIIFPLYIPYEKDYYAQAFEVFEMSLNSLHKTVSIPIKVSVVSNNSCNEVNQKLLKLVQDKKIDELVIESEAIGKINSIFKIIRSVNERFVTISDADVLFCNNWDNAVFDVFENFPKSGAVCPVPVFRTHLQLTANIWFDYFFSKRLLFKAVKNAAALEKFAKSIGRDSLPESHKDYIGTLTNKKGATAVLGCSHFVATYKREVFQAAPKGMSNYILGGNSELEFLDLPVIKFDGYRLATYDNYAFHMGNTIEKWMYEHYENLETKGKSHREIKSNILKKNYFIYVLKNKIFKKLFYNQIFYKKMMIYKGLPKLIINNFFN